MAWSETGKRFVVASSLTCFSISFHLFANRTEKRNKARTRKRPKFIPKFIVRIVRDDQSLPDSIVKTESLSLSLSALDPVLFSRFRRPSRFIGECNFRWSRNPAEREAIRYTIYPIKLLELHRPTTIFNLFFRAFLLPFPLEFRFASVLSRSNKSYRYHPNIPRVPVVPRTQQLFASRQQKFFVSFRSPLDVILGTNVYVRRVGT